MGKSVQVHKSHKTRFSSKASRSVHRTSQTDKARISKDHKNHAGGNRASRLQHKKMVRDKKRVSLLKEKKASTGASSPPRVIVLFGITDKTNLMLLTNDILKLLAPVGLQITSNTVSSPDHKIRTTILVAPHGDLVSCMEMFKLADYIAFVASGFSLCESSDSGSAIDSFGSQCLSIMRTIGFPNTAVLIRDLPVEIKKRQDLKKKTISLFASELPKDCKFYPADTNEDILKFIRVFKEQHDLIPYWRQQRPYLMADEVSIEHDCNDIGQCSLLLSGYVRAHCFSANQLIHISGAGDFQLSKIDVLNDPFPINTQRRNSDMMESEDFRGPLVLHSVFPDSLKIDPLIVENVPDPLTGEQTWPTEMEMEEAKKTNKEKKPRKKVLPRETSDYQACWIVDNSDTDVESLNDGDGMIVDDGEGEYLNQEQSDHSDADEAEDNAAETEIDEMMGDDENLSNEQIEAEIKRIKNAHSEDGEFPDEIDTPLDVPAQKRFAKYRGLKSFRTSPWDPKELLPIDYGKIFALDNPSRTQKLAHAKIEEIDNEKSDESISVASYVRLHVKGVPIEAASKISSMSKRVPIVASGLMPHESKLSVLNFSAHSDGHIFQEEYVVRITDCTGIKKHDSYDAPVKSKEQLIFHIGFRQVIARYPQRVSKLKAVIRFMFHNPDDVRWFKPVDLWTKCGRHGRIKEPVGTHGSMKGIFDGVVQQHDVVCMSLYKRVYPKWPENLYDLQ
ncbi:Pre-rRNA-processing protein TSR1-like protein [Zostera marina]|uniref:Pre-rRNA-processing protein TSR1-like protein n=1 Tax=Zostera marina TaxID=29655 RepID=A0A0K9PVS9_ZOSMR|nr:Pre-rRNA-processing protein TSR1-like protein [Zostera marina]